ncbi:LapA family protein [Spongiibacter sp.]|uniref:LapA family protein n=1 Tax=Spongiibacter sp. TaxID=2024860 RepID=UPI003569123E
MQILKSILVLLLLLAVVLFGLLFSLENTALVPLNILVAELPEQRISTWLILSFLVGGVCGMLSASLLVLRLQAAKLRLRRNLKQSATQLVEPGVNR